MHRRLSGFYVLKKNGVCDIINESLTCEKLWDALNNYIETINTMTKKYHYWKNIRINDVFIEYSREEE